MVKIIFIHHGPAKVLGVKFHTLRTGVKFGADLFIDGKGINDESFFSNKKKSQK